MKQTLMSATPNDTEHPITPKDTKPFQIGALRPIATPILALDKKLSFIEKYATPGILLGYVRDIPRYYSKSLNTTLKEEINITCR